MPRADHADLQRTTVEFLQLLARAARQFRTYPATSSLCTDAIDACYRAFVVLSHDEPVAVRVTADQLLLNDEPVEADTAIDQELRRPLHAAHVGSIELERGASARDVTHFCIVLAEARRTTHDVPTFAERLMDAGVNAIVVRMTPRPEVLRLSDPPQNTRRLIAFERARARQATVPDGPAQYLYPPDKGWVRVDPTADDSSISLVDLTLLVHDPKQLATILAHLVDDAVEGAEEAPLCGRYDDVVTLIGALEPRLGRMLMAKLARAVLDLDIERRRALLRRSILPHLLDGRTDGEAVLAAFPDVELADALGLLLDLEMASPEVLPLALDRLQLAPERRRRMMPLVDAKCDGHRTAASGDRWAAAGFDDQARKLTHVDGKTPRQFAEFAAFDLSIDEATRTALADARAAVAATDATEVWLASLLRLARLQPNPTVVVALLERAVPQFHAFARDERWPDLVRWLAKVSDIATDIGEARPDVSDAIRGVLQRLCNRDFLLQIANLCLGESARDSVPHLVAAFGPSVVPAWLDALSSAADRSAAMRLRPIICECAAHTAPAIARRLADLRPDVAAVAVTVLGFAGAGYETAISTRIETGDETLGREGLRALARIASPKAASLIASLVARGGSVQPVAEEALWRLPSSLALTHARELLRRREFVAHFPQAAARLLERVAQGGGVRDLEPVLESLAPLRFHFWNPAIARVGAKARGLM